MKYFIAFLLISSHLFAADDVITVYLTWQKAPETSMSVQWITPQDQQESSLEYFSDEKKLHYEWGTHAEMPGDPSYLLHRVVLSHLTPDTIYTFKVDPEGQSYQFRTLPDQLQGPLAFVQGGDMYYKSIGSMEAISLKAAETNPYFALLGGDLADGAKYEGPEEVRHWLDWLISWEKCMQTPNGLLIPIVTAIGNHEVKGKFHQSPEEAQLFYFLFPTPENIGYYALDFGNYMSLFILDSGHTSEVLGEQSEWLALELKRRAHFPYKFAVYHVPAFPAAILKKPNPIGEEIVQSWVPIFEQFGLTAAFEHHCHAYKRTFPLRAGSIDPSGVVYLGEGGWGADKMAHIHSPESLWYLAKSESKRHFILVTLDPMGVCYQAIDAQGNILDESIVK